MALVIEMATAARGGVSRIQEQVALAERLLHEGHANALDSIRAILRSIEGNANSIHSIANDCEHRYRHGGGPVETGGTVAVTVADLQSALQPILKKLETFMATLDETLAAVTAEDTKIDGIIALVTGLKQQLADALAGTTLPPAVQQKIDAVFATATASAGKIDTALAANTPAAPPATPPAS